MPTVDVTDTAYDELAKVFQAQNRVEDFFFQDATLKQDWLGYRIQIGEIDWWRKQGWDTLQSHVNAVIAVDLPAVQETERPEPEFFVIPTENIWHISNDSTGKCLWLIYYVDVFVDEETVREIYVYDDLFYRKYIQKSDGDIELMWEVPHDLGYTPARQFWANPLGDSLVQKQGPISASLGNLDWLLYSQISKRHLDLYAGFPIISMYEQECTYETEDGFKCDGGFVRYERTDPRTGKERIYSEVCPKCGGKQTVGPGTLLTVPAPADTEDADNIPGVVITAGDVRSLQQMQDEIDRQIKNFLETTIGFGGESTNEQAKNQKQIQSNFETRESILQELSNNFSIIQKWTLDTIGKLRYGPDEYVGSVLNYGTKFFLVSVDDMLETYRRSVTQGMPSSDLMQQRDAIYAKKFSNDPVQQVRIQMMVQLEPLERYTVEQLIRMGPFLDVHDLAFKLYFDDLLQEFERENGKIQRYLPDLDMNIRVETIKKKMDEYLDAKDINFELLQSSQIALETGAGQSFLSDKRTFSRAGAEDTGAPEE